MASENELEAAMASSSGSDSDDSDGLDLDLTPEDMQAIMDAEERLEKNVYDYDGQAQYVALLRRCGLEVKLEEARQTMRSMFPLRPPAWLDWLEDAEKAWRAGSRSQGDVRSLYELAVKDYVSVEVWRRYEAFQRAAAPEDQAATRELFERALQAAGIHVALGDALWDDYIGFEVQNLPAIAEASEEALARVSRLHRRRLSIPLLGHERALEAWKAWHGGLPEAARDAVLDSEVVAAHERATRMLADRQEFEERVGSSRGVAAEELLDSFQQYLDYEKTQGDPARVQCVYERAIVAFPATQHLWLQYGRYLETTLPKIHGVVLAAYARACRDCPWVGALWERRLRALQRRAEAGVGEAMAQHEVVYREACASGAQTPDELAALILARLHALRCQGRVGPLQAAYDEALAALQSRFPEELDLALSLSSFAAEALAQVQGAGSPESADAPVARRVWEACLRSGQGRRLAPWTEAIAFELRRAQVAKARGLYRRAHSRRLEDGGQPVLCSQWLAFEGLHGSGADHLAATLKAEPIIEAAAQAAWAAAQQAEPAPLSEEEALERRRANDPNYNKRKAGGEEAEREGDGRDARPKRARTAASPEPSAEPAPASPPPPRHVAFVKHLADSVGEAEIRSLFEQCGGILDVRLGTNPKTHKSKGFAYVEFDTKQALERACELDRSQFHGKHIFVAPSERPAYMKDRSGPEVAARPRDGRPPKRVGALEADAAPHATMKPRLSAPLVPRAAALQRARAAPQAQARTKPQQRNEEAQADAEGSATGHVEDNGEPKSNTDFRAMLLGPKG